MQCPACEGGTLKPQSLEPGLAALGCEQCRGALVSMLAYRAWRDGSGHDHGTADIAIEAQDSRGALLCPKCRRVMGKYRISDAHGNRLDLCGNCAEVWLDRGEWQMLERLNLAEKLPVIFSEPWQYEVMRGEQEAAYEARQAQLFGAQDYAKVRDFRAWLRAHPQSAALRMYLSRRRADA